MPDPFTVVRLALSVGVLALLFVAPGLTWSRLDPARPTGLVPAVGLAVGWSLLVAWPLLTLLAVVGFLRPPIVLFVMAAATVAPLALHQVRAGIVASARAYVRRPRLVLAGLIGLALVGLLVVAEYLGLGRSAIPFSTTVWYYALLARTMADTGGLPAEFVEWGSPRPFQTDYLPVTAHTAAALELMPVGFLPAIELVGLAILGSAVLVGALLFRRWLSPPIALLAGLLLVSTARLEVKFESYKPETAALVLGLFAMWLVDRALARPTRGRVGTALAASALTFLAHAEVFLLLGPAIVAMTAVRLVPGLLGRHGGLRIELRRVAAGVAILVLGAALGLVAARALTGDAAIIGYLVRTDAQPVDRSAIATLADALPGWAPTEDPTWDFGVVAASPSMRDDPPPGGLSIVARFLRLLPGDALRPWLAIPAQVWDLLAFAVCTALPLAAWRALRATERRATVTWLIFGLALAAGSLLVVALFERYVPMRIGPRRLFPYELFLPVVGVAVALAVVDRALRAGPLRRVGKGLTRASSAAIMAILAALLVISPVGGAGDTQSARLSSAGLAAYTWIARNTPPTARLLVGAYTDGVVPVLARRVSVTDGRAPYLEDPVFLRDATRLVLGARLVILKPRDPRSLQFLRAERIDYVLVARDTTRNESLGGYRPFRASMMGLERVRHLRLLRSFGDGEVLLFAVRFPR